jgi:MOSC domain-containing protein YiiM
MWNERKMPERWYELLRERMQVEEQRMRVIHDGEIIEHDDLEQLMAQADSLDREMLMVMRQAIAGAIEANTSAASLHARSAEWRAGLSRFSPSDFA